MSTRDYGEATICIGGQPVGSLAELIYSAGDHGARGLPDDRYSFEVSGSIEIEPGALDSLFAAFGIKPEPPKVRVEVTRGEPGVWCRGWTQMVLGDCEQRGRETTVGLVLVDLCQDDPRLCRVFVRRLPPRRGPRLLSRKVSR